MTTDLLIIFNILTWGDVFCEVLSLRRGNQLNCLAYGNDISEALYIYPPNIYNANIKTIAKIDLNWSYNRSKWQEADSFTYFLSPITDRRWNDFEPIRSETLNLVVNKVSSFSICLKRELTIIFKNNTLWNFTGNNSHNEICKWRHFTLKHEIPNTLLIYSENMEIATRNMSSDNNNFDFEITVRSESETLWKKHEYTYLELKFPFDGNNKSEITTTLNASGKICLLFYISLNINSYFDVIIEYNNITEVERYTSISNNSLDIKDWQIVRIERDNVENEISITFRPNVNTSKPGFWAIETKNIYNCSDFDTIQYTLDKNNSDETICKILNNNNNLSAYNFDKIGFLSENISCGHILRDFPNCEGHKIYTQNTSFCAWNYKGEDCSEACDPSYFGIGYRHCAISIVNIEHNSMNITWDQEIINNFDNFSITYWPVNHLLCNVKLHNATKQSVNIKKEQYYQRIENLQPFTNYTFQFTTINQASIIKYESTKADPKIRAIELPKDIQIRENSLLQIFLNNCDKFNGNVTFIIELICINSNCENVTSLTVDLNRSNFNESFTILNSTEPIQNYKINITAKRLNSALSQIFKAETRNSIMTTTSIKMLYILLATIPLLLCLILMIILIFFLYCKKSDTAQPIKERLPLNQIADNSYSRPLSTEMAKVESKVTEQFLSYVVNDFDNLIPIQYQIIANRYNNNNTQNSSNNKSIKKTNSEKFNNNYIQGFAEQKRFITSSPPTPQYFKTFWTMICKENVSAIITLNKEDPKYWPQDEKSVINIGETSIENLKTYKYPGFSIRELLVTSNQAKLKRQSKRSRLIRHFIYEDWSWDYTFMLDCLAKFMLKILELVDENSLILLHSNENYARSSVVILCEMALRMSAEDKQMDFFKILSHIKAQNNLLVSDFKEYILAHFVVLECLNEQNPSNVIKINRKFKSEVEKILKMNSIGPIISRLNVAKEIRKPLKRYLNTTVPRIIKAINGSREFIVEKQPNKFEREIERFWKEVLNLDLDLVVTLNHKIEKESNKFVTKFWPEEVNEELRLAAITIKNVKIVENAYYIDYRLKLSFNSEQKYLNLICLKHWRHERTVPQYFDGLLYVWREMIVQSRDVKKQILITCYDGFTASGLLIALSFLIDTMKNERVCDVFSVIKSLRIYNNNFVKSWEQFEMLYKLAVEYVIKFEESEYSDAIADNFLDV